MEREGEGWNEREGPGRIKRHGEGDRKRRNEKGESVWYGKRRNCNTIKHARKIQAMMSPYTLSFVCSSLKWT